jgi:hypothetical protein
MSRARINVYMEWQHYGGPEEGGWWYYSGWPVPASELRDAWTGIPGSGRHDGHTPLASFDASPRRIARIARWIERENDKRPELHETNSNGRYCYCIERHAPRAWPKSRLHYE